MFGSGLRLTLLWVAIGMALGNKCPKPVRIANSNFEVNEDVATYHCGGGFKFEGKSRSVSCKNGVWENVNFICQETCGRPPNLGNAIITHSEEESVTYKCVSESGPNVNQSINSNIELKCHENKWEIPDNPCLEESRTTLLNSSDGNANDTSMTFGNISTTLYENDTSQWDNVNRTTLSPEKESRTTLLNSSDGNANDTSMTVGNISTTLYENDTSQWDNVNRTTLSPENGVLCDDNTTCTLRMEANDTNLCIEGLISGTNISCISNYSETCPEPMNISNSITQREGNEVIYMCMPGYIQVKNLSISFCENGTWTEIDVNCFPESCGLPPHVPSSKVTFDGDTAYFTCESEFLPKGNVSISICENGSWSEINMTCVSKASLMMKSRQHQKNKEFQNKLKNSDSLICSFNDNGQICKCNNKYAIIVSTSNQMIAKHNSFSIPATSLKECETFCVLDESCLSLEFKESGKTCQLSRTVSYLVESIMIMETKGVIYGEKVCAEFIMEDQVRMPYQPLDLNMYHPNALFCSMNKEKITCGCIEGKLSFKSKMNKKIGMHNMFSFKTEDPRNCVQRCLDTQNCLSAEFKYFKKICQLSKTARYLADEYIFRDSQSTIYFEKICVQIEIELENTGQTFDI